MMSFEREVLSASQVRAARAMLAWSQRDLAEVATVATSTIADFERGHRTPVPNNAQAMRNALEAQGITFTAGGAVLASKFKPALLEPTPGVPLRWISATDLSQWGERRDGQAGLPELLMRLIYAVKGPRARLRFPSDESIAYPGWDGICEVETEAPFIPAGRSVWEIGAQRGNVAGKAQSDYEKRSENPLGLAWHETTFIFVTPQRWPNKDEWSANRRADGKWRDVRVYDADDLVHWLDMSPAVAIWLAIRVGRRPEGLRELSEVWDEWSQATEVPLSEELIGMDRDDDATAVLRWLARPPSLLSIQAEGADESIAFLHAALSPLPHEHLLSWQSRCVVAESEDVARRLVGIGPKLIVVLSGCDPGLAARLVADGHHVYNAFGSEVGSPPNVLRLARPWRESLEFGLQQAGVAAERAHSLAANAGRSITVLRRLMRTAPGRAPSWAASTPSQGLLAAMLAGAWRQDSPADRQIIESLAGASYDVVEQDLSSLAVVMDSPLRRSGFVWKLASLRDAWMQLAPFLTETHIDRLLSVFVEVLGAENPEFDVDPAERWRTPRSNLNDRPSDELRRGLTEALIALGVFPDRACNVSEASSRVDHAVRTLISRANGRVLWSLCRDFCRLAEASPTGFLAAIQDALDNPDQPLGALFRSDESFLGAGEYLADLLWALETLAWSPEHLSSVALILGRLAEIDPGGRTMNRPANSLRQILLSWSPQTHATSEERIQVLDLLLRRSPEVGWTTLLSLVPRGQDTSHPSPLPVWRDFTIKEREIITSAKLAKTNWEIGVRLLERAGDDAGRWQSLLEHWANFEPAWRCKAAVQLSDAIPGFVEPSTRQNLREALRALLHRHRNYPNAPWALDEIDLAPLDSVLDTLEPDDARERYAWLFANVSDYLYAETSSWEDRRESLRVAQIEAAEKIVAECDTKDILEFGRSAKMSWDFGCAVMTSTRISESDKERLMETALETALETVDTEKMSLGMLHQSVERCGIDSLEARFDAALAAGRPDQVLLRLALVLTRNSSTWQRVESAGGNVERGYWQRISLFGIDETEDIVAICDKLIAANRSAGAVTFIGDRIEKAAPSSELLIRILVTASERNALSSGNIDAVMFSYHVSKLFKYLDEDDSVNEEQISRLEWIYFNVLEHSDRPPRTLHKALAASPEFFVELLCAVFLPSADSGVVESEASSEDEAKRIAEQAYRVLHQWSRIPGSSEDGEINGELLEAWVSDVRRRCVKVGRGKIGDERIGDILSAAPRRLSESWPPIAVRDVIENSRSSDIELGFEIGVYNRRGVTTRRPLDGGEQERELSRTYRSDAQASAFEWPRTKALLHRISETYSREADGQDQHVEQMEW